MMNNKGEVTTAMIVIASIALALVNGALIAQKLDRGEQVTSSDYVSYSYTNTPAPPDVSNMGKYCLVKGAIEGSICGFSSMTACWEAQTQLSSAHSMSYCQPSE